MGGDVRAEWHAAFAAAQAEMPPIGKDRKATIQSKGGASYSYSYADLASILEAVTPVLARHGLSVAQSVTTSGDRVGVETRVFHAAGHVEVFGPLELPAGGDARSVGSAVTYARRYALAAALGIAPDEDDDGAAAKPAARPAAKPAGKTPKEPEVTYGEIRLPSGAVVIPPDTPDGWTRQAKAEAVHLYDGDVDAGRDAYISAVRELRGLDEAAWSDKDVLALVLGEAEARAVMEHL